MKIYFAGSIRGGRDDMQLYLQIINILGEYGQVLTEHIGNQELSVSGESDQSDEYIYQRDLSWLNEADAVIAEVSTPSLGVGYEIGRMEREKPILCLYRKQEGKKLSAMLGGNKELVVRVYEDLDELRGIVDSFMNQLSENKKK